MKRIILCAAVVAGFLASCQSNKSTEEKIDSLATSPDTSVTNVQSCYSYVNDRDTVSLSYIKAGNAIAGNLNYNLFQKDKNAGTVAGIIKGDTVIADYTFSSEGTTSYRQVVFLKKGDQLVEGYGPSQEVDGKSRFTDISKLKFGGQGTIVLSAIPCK